jgi:hypothetical protein
MIFWISVFELEAAKSHLRNRDATLSLVFPGAIRVTGLARLRCREKDDLSQSLVGVNTGRQWRGIGNFQGYMTFPLRLQGRDVHDNAATCVGALADTEREHVARNAEILNAAGERKRVRRHQTRRAAHIHKRARIECFRINDGVKDVGKNLEFIRYSQVVTIARQAVADDRPAAGLSGQAFFEGVDHVVFARHAPYPGIGMYAHVWFLNQVFFVRIFDAAAGLILSDAGLEEILFPTPRLHA